jgi:F-type H+-transporting ATPase subunit epsilon
MASTMHCDIVSAEKEIFSGRITMLVANASLGEIGILPGHAPLLTGILPGPVRLKFESGEEEVFFASGGYLEVQPTAITVLADTASRADDVDEAAALQARERAQRAMTEQSADFEYSVAAAQLAEASARLRTLEELKKRKR